MGVYENKAPPKLDPPIVGFPYDEDSNKAAPKSEPPHSHSVSWDIPLLLSGG